MQTLDAKDVYYGFDFEDICESLKNDLQAQEAQKFGIKCQVILKGNSRWVCDSYNWNLSNMIFEMREQKLPGIFDAVYLDAAHTFLFSGLGICLLKELIKDEGFLILDDVYWVMYSNAWLRERAIKNKMPEDQLHDKQILRAKKIFLDNDPNFEEISEAGNWRAVFRKRIKR